MSDFTQFISPGPQDPYGIWSLGPNSTNITPNGIVSSTSTVLVTTSETWLSTNRAIFVPFFINQPVTLAKAWIRNGATASGNFDLGIYTLAGVKVCTTGTTAQSGTTAIQSAAISGTLSPGQYYMAAVMNGTTGTVAVVTSANLGISISAVGCAEMASAFVLPATITPATCGTMTSLPLFGFTARSFV